jgi:hypothetical protein
MDLSISDVRELVALLKDDKSILPIRVGTCYLIRTVTMHYTGRVEEVTDSFIRLSDAAWIADTGRFWTCLTTGELGEVEPYPGDVLVSRGAIVDMTEWQHPLPREQK